MNEQRLPDDCQDEGEDENGRAAVNPYQIRDGHLVHIKQTNNGPRIIPLCNFYAQIIREIEYDDGAEVTKCFEIFGIREEGQIYPTIAVSAKVFCLD